MSQLATPKKEKGGILLERKYIKYRLLRILNIIILIMLIILILFFDTESGKYEKIFWSIPIIVAVLLISDDMIKDIESKNKIFIRIESLIFFINWILLSSMLIILMFLDLSLVFKIISLIFLFTINYLAYKRYMSNKNE